MGFELTTLVVIGTNCIGSCKSNYHTITTMTAPISFIGNFDIFPYMSLWYCQYQLTGSNTENDQSIINVTSNTHWQKQKRQYWRSRDTLSLVSQLLLSDTSDNICLNLHNCCYSILTRAMQSVAYPLAYKLDRDLDLWPWKSMLILECSQGCYAVKIWLLDLWPWKSIRFQTLLRTKYVPSLVKIHWRMLILECSQGCYAVKIWPGDHDPWPWKSIESQTLLWTKYVPSLVKIHWRMLILVFTRMLC